MSSGLRLATCWILVTLSAAAEDARITHGPILGRIGPHHVGVWARTSQPHRFRVRYGTHPERLDQSSPLAVTRLEHDNTGWVLLEDLRPHTQYFYQVVADDVKAPATPVGRFRTLPSRETYRDEETNPDGLFNFSFEFGCGNKQSAGTTRMAVFDTLLDQHLDDVDFAIANGDWIYEEHRDLTVEAWQRQVGVDEPNTPNQVQMTPSIVGVWENYKSYLDRCTSLARWHRNMPSLFMYDDHEIIDDTEGAGTIGARPRRGVFRDIAVQAWYDYVGWSNPVDTEQKIHFGTAELRSGSGFLLDRRADFTKLRWREAAELHVHWGGPNAGLLGKHYDDVGGDPNAGVYQVVRVVDENRLEIRPAPQHDGQVSYSIGRRSYFRMPLANCDLITLDTRGHRDQTVQGNPWADGISILGAAQKQWLKQTMTSSNAQCFFLVSTVNFMIPHVADVATPTENEDSWTGYIQERDEMLEFFDRLGKKVFLLTGDLHNSFVVKMSDNVWEFASGPHNSGNAQARSEGDRPPNGDFDSYGRKCFVRWSTWFDSREAARLHPRKIYCIVAVNNVLPNASEQNPKRVKAFPHPQVVFQFYDGLTGNLLYAESILIH